MTTNKAGSLEKARQQLKEALNQVVNIDDHMIDEGLQRAHFRHLKKGDYLCQSHFVCHRLSFVLEGMLRSYYLDQGEEVTLYLIGKNMIATSLFSFISRKNGNENLQAITDCTLLEISREGLYELYDRFPIWERIGRKVTEDAFLRLEERMISQLVQTAEERYSNWSKKFAPMLKEVPLQHVASMLGMKPETLSRIRHKMSENPDS